MCVGNESLTVAWSGCCVTAEEETQLRFLQLISQSCGSSAAHAILQVQVRGSVTLTALTAGLIVSEAADRQHFHSRVYTDRRILTDGNDLLPEAAWTHDTQAGAYFLCLH